MRRRRPKLTKPQIELNRPNLPWSFTIFGAPRTKNTGRVIGAPGRPGIIIPPKPYRRWYAEAMMQMPIIRRDCKMRGFCGEPVDVTAVFYRDRDQGDEDRFMIALGDFLEDAGLVWNDDLIHWTGDTRREIDRENPRVEVKIATRK